LSLIFSLVPFLKKGTKKLSKNMLRILDCQLKRQSLDFRLVLIGEVLVLSFAISFSSRIFPHRNGCRAKATEASEG